MNLPPKTGVRGAQERAEGALAGEAGEQGRSLTDALRVARELLGMQVAWVAEFRDGSQVFQTVEGDPASFGISEGSAVPIDETYCIRLARGEIPGIVPDASAEPAVADLDATREGRVGAYVGVPIELEDGTVFGTICCASPRPNHGVTDADLGFLRTIALRVAKDIEERRLRARPSSS